MKHWKIKLLCLIITLCLCSCSTQNNGSTDYQSEKNQLVNVSDIYKNYEDYLGKNYEKFSIPENISKLEIDKVYTLECNIKKNHLTENDVQDIFSKFYGEKYLADNYYYDKNGGFLYSAGENTSSYWGSDLLLFSDNYKIQIKETEENPIVAYFISKIQDNETFTINNSTFNVGEKTKYINDNISNMLSKMYSDYSITTEQLYLINESGQENICFICSLNYLGVPIQSNHSEYSAVDNMGKICYWLMSQISGLLDSSGNFLLINANTPYTICNKEEQAELIPFSYAIEILQEELAENIHFNFIDCKLMYCCRYNQPALNYTDPADISETEKKADDYNSEIKSFEPMWCFEVENDDLSTTKGYVKVNALTGEIYMDII